MDHKDSKVEEEGLGNKAQERTDKNAAASNKSGDGVERKAPPDRDAGSLDHGELGGNFSDGTENKEA